MVPTSADTRSRDALLAENAKLLGDNAALKRQLAWFKRQMFGEKSEKRLFDHPDQLPIGAHLPAPPIQEQATEVVTYTRGKGPKVRGDDCVTDTGLRFDDTVPNKIINLPVLGLEDLSEDDVELITVREYCKLAMRPASYVVLRYRQPVLKVKPTGDIVSGIAVAGTIDKSIADVSFIVGTMVDKFQYHLPLYRQHQRLQNSGIVLSRSTLLNLVKRAIMLLEPIVDAQTTNILISRILAMDETPIKAGRSKARKGRMHQGYLWPIYGEHDEVVFIYKTNRNHSHVNDILGTAFTGTLLRDGYEAYDRYASKHAGVTSAQCWAHTRRHFVEARDSDPSSVDEVVAMIGELYEVEKDLREQSLEGEKKHNCRVTRSKPIVNQIFEWAEDQLQRLDLVPGDPYLKAVNYLYSRKQDLSVFLEDPDVPLDTNHLERQIRPVAMGKRSWLFCWTELGAKHVGIIQSLICTCKLHGIDPYTYLIDVLQRINIHPDSQIMDLTPRLWKEKFADDPMGSDLEIAVNDGVE